MSGPDSDRVTRRVAPVTHTVQKENRACGYGN
jgi:hypothetical protein